jgi:hypothetical protein
MSGFRLRCANEAYDVSDRVDLPFAGNCGNKWQAPGLKRAIGEVNFFQLTVWDMQLFSITAGTL